MQYMPARLAFGEDDLEVISEVFQYYRNINADPGYQGYFEKQYTDAFVNYLGGGGYADAVCSGTAALYIGIAALQLEAQSEVIVSPITDPGSISAIILNRLVPVLADTSPFSYNISAAEVKKKISNKSKAILVVHAAGKAAPIDEICEIAREYGLYVVEDCSQAHGARYNGNKIGTFGDIAAFSTMYRKSHSTGGCGGIIYTKGQKLYSLIRAYADRGKNFFSSEYDEKDPDTFLFPALNLNIDEISCALGYNSLSKLEHTRIKRLDFLLSLDKALTKESKVCSLVDFSLDNSPFFQPIKVNSEMINCSKIEFAHKIKKKNIPVNPHYKYIVSEWHWAIPYLKETAYCKNAIECRNNSFNLLLNENYGLKEVEKIMKVILEVEEETCR